MRNLEKLIDVIKRKAHEGWAPIAIAKDLIEQGMDEDLVFWALRGAQHELSQSHMEGGKHA